jgi:predicted type IV restriction endonuclease
LFADIFHSGILIDDNNRKPICRLHFNGSRKLIGFFDGPRESQKDGLKEERVALEHMDDLYKHAERLKITVARYEAKPAGVTA